MPFAIMRMEKIKSVSKGSARLKHSRREIACPTADPHRKSLALSCSPLSRDDWKKSFKEIFHERTNGQKVRKNAVYAVEIVLTFSPGAVPQEQLKNWTGASINWIGAEFGGRENIIDARLHLDEATPHIHAFVVPIDEKGRLNARHFVGGTSSRFSELQTSYAKAVEQFGLDRGISKKITHAEHVASQRWHAENADKEVRLQAYEKVFGQEQEWNFETFVEFQTTTADIQRRVEASNKPQELMQSPAGKDIPADNKGLYEREYE